MSENLLRELTADELAYEMAWDEEMWAHDRATVELERRLEEERRRQEDEKRRQEDERLEKLRQELAQGQQELERNRQELEQNRQDLVRNMKAKGMDAVLIAELTGLSVEKIQAL